MSVVHASLLLATVHAAALTVAPGPGDACPTSVQVLGALDTHASALVTPRPDDDPAKLLTLTLMPAAPSGETSFSLIDKAGLVKLYRSLAAPAGDRTRDCAALADTVAFIVIRYFEEVELPALPERKPPPPPPEPPLPPPPKPLPPPPPKPAAYEGAEKIEPAKLALSILGGRRFPGAATDFSGFEAKATAGVLLSGLAQRTGDLWLDVGVGFAGHGTIVVAERLKDSVTTNRVSGELALLAGWRLGQSRLYAGPAANLDLIWIESELGGRTQREQRFAAAAGIKIGYQYFWSGRVFARTDLTTDVALVKEQAAVVSGTRTDVVLTAPRMYVTVALGLGVWF